MEKKKRKKLIRARPTSKKLVGRLSLVDAQKLLIEHSLDVTKLMITIGIASLALMPISITQLANESNEKLFFGFAAVLIFTSVISGIWNLKVTEAFMSSRLKRRQLTGNVLESYRHNESINYGLKLHSNISTKVQLFTFLFGYALIASAIFMSSL